MNLVDGTIYITSVQSLLKFAVDHPGLHSPILTILSLQDLGLENIQFINQDAFPPSCSDVLLHFFT